MKLSTVLAVLVSVAGGYYLWYWATHPNELPGVTITTPNPKPEEIAFVERAAAIFLAECGNLESRYAREVERIEIWIRDTQGLWPDEGWRFIVNISVSLSDPAPSVPREWRANGHTLTYWMVAGHKPGIIGINEISQLICGMPVDARRSTFKAVPAAAFVDEFVPPPPVAIPWPGPNGTKAPVVTADSHYSAEVISFIERTLPVFAAACPKLLSEHIGDITSISAGLDRAPNDDDRARGWDASVWLNFDFAAQATTIPPEIMEYLGWGGSFQFGGGREPGILADGVGARWLCDMTDIADDTVVPIPELAFLDALD